MKLEDIKNMSDEEFIELVINAVKNGTEENLPDNVRIVSPEKFNYILKLCRGAQAIAGAAIGGLSAQLIGIISMEFGAGGDKAGIIA